MKQNGDLEKKVRKEAIKATSIMMLVYVLVVLAVSFAASFTAFGLPPMGAWFAFGVLGVIIAIVAYFDFKKEFIEILKNSSDDKEAKENSNNDEEVK